MTNKAGIRLSSDPEDAVASAATTSGVTIGSARPLAKAGVVKRLKLKSAAAQVLFICLPQDEIQRRFSGAGGVSSTLAGIVSLIALDCCYKINN